MGSAEDAMKKLVKRRIVASISTFYFSNLYTKLSRKKLSMVHNSLTNFCFGEGEKIKNIKDNVIYLNKHKIKDAVFISFLIDILRLAQRSSAILLVFIWDLIHILFLPTYSYIPMKIKGLKN